MTGNYTRPTDPRQLSRESARRISTAGTRLRNAKQCGPRETVEALRLVLLSAVKTNPSHGLVNEIADQVLAGLPDLYLAADERWSGR